MNKNNKVEASNDRHLGRSNAVSLRRVGSNSRVILLTGGDAGLSDHSPLVKLLSQQGVEKNWLYLNLVSFEETKHLHILAGQTASKVALFDRKLILVRDIKFEGCYSVSSRDAWVAMLALFNEELSVDDYLPNRFYAERGGVRLDNKTNPPVIGIYCIGIEVFVPKYLLGTNVSVLKFESLFQIQVASEVLASSYHLVSFGSGSRPIEQSTIVARVLAASAFPPLEVLCLWSDWFRINLQMTVPKFESEWCIVGGDSQLSVDPDLVVGIYGNAISADFMIERVAG